MGGIQSVRGGRKNDKPLWVDGTENPALFEINSIDADPTAGDFTVVRYNELKNEKKWHNTEDICVNQGEWRDYQFKPCHADENIWVPWRETPSCGDRDDWKKGSYGGCTNELVQYGTAAHCYGQKCARIKADKVCPTLGKDGVKSTTARPQKIGTIADVQGRRVVCTYDVASLSSDCKSAAEWTRKRREELAAADLMKNPAHDGHTIDGKDMSKWFHRDLMMSLCDKRAPEGVECKNGKYKGKDGKPECSNVMACDLCRQWATTTDWGKVETDKMISGWCDDPLHFDPKKFDDPKSSDPACRCYRIHQKPPEATYTAMPEARCWYPGCQDFDMETSLVPSSVRDGKDVKCEAFCAQLINFIDDGVVEIGDINLNLSCGGGSGWWGKLPTQKKVALVLGVCAVGAGGYLVYRGAGHTPLPLTLK